MKKLVSIFMLILLLGTSSHLKASLHFCGDVLTQFGWGDHETEPCECADMSSMDCCEDVIIKTQDTNPAVVSSFHFKSFQTSFVVFHLIPSLELSEINFCKEFQSYSNQHFRQRREPDLSLLSVFRI